LDSPRHGHSTIHGAPSGTASMPVFWACGLQSKLLPYPPLADRQSRSAIHGATRFADAAASMLDFGLAVCEANCCPIRPWADRHGYSGGANLIGRCS
jgi:hypothetical protein